MIYGEKFLNTNNNVINKESLDFLLKEDVINFNNFLKNFNTEIDSFNEAKENVIDKIIEKILDLLRKVGVYIQKFINNMKYKIFKLGEKIISNLDRLIAGKFSPTDEDLTAAAADRLAMTLDPKAKLSIEEAASDNIEFYMICPGPTYQGIIINYSEDLFSLAKEFLQLYDKDANYSEDHKDEIDKLVSKYNVMKSTITGYINDLQDNDSKIRADINDIKNYIGDKKFPSDAGKTRNKYINYKKFTFAKDDKDSMKKMRDFIQVDLSITNTMLKELTKKKNDIADKIREVKHIKDQYNRAARGNGNGTVSSIESDLRRTINDIDRIYFQEYRLLNTYMNEYLYCAKNDFKIAIRCINKWGNKKAD